MQPSDLNRRDFGKLALAALAGLVAGTGLSQAKEKKRKHKNPKKNLWLQDPHICRGLNPSCKGQVDGKKNACAGQSHCATVKAHACKGHNECAGEGG